MQRASEASYSFWLSSVPNPRWPGREGAGASHWMNAFRKERARELVEVGCKSCKRGS